MSALPTPPTFFWGETPEEEFYNSQNVRNTKSYYQTKNGKIFTQSFRPLDKTRPIKGVVFMTHGYGSDSSWCFQKICIEYAKWGYDVYAADLLGHGRSDGLHGYLGDMDKVAATSLEYFLNVRKSESYCKVPAFLFGESMGGMITMLMYLQSESDTWTGLIFSAPLFVIPENMIPSKQEKMVYVKDLQYGCAGLPIELRILRRWIPHFRDKDIWFLGVDELGQSIAILGVNQGKQFLESRFALGHCYALQHYSCTETLPSQRMIENPVHINAGEASQIHMIEDEKKIPEISFNFTPLEKLYAFLDTPTYNPDFVGNYKRQRVATKRNGDPFMLLTLTAPGGQDITLTVWTECMQNPEKVNTNALSTATEDTILAVTNVKPTTFANTLKLSSTDATHIIMNPRLNERYEYSQHTEATGTKCSDGASNKSMTINELLFDSYEALPRKAISTEARVTEAHIENSWYIASCPDCKGHMSKQNESWFCPNHGQKSIPNFFYNVKVTISDGTASLQAMITDSCMQSLIGKTCKEIIINDGYEDRKTLPPSFKTHAMNTNRFYMEMTKKSNPGNFNFIIVKKESLSVSSPAPPPNTPSATQSITTSTTDTSPQTTTPDIVPGKSDTQKHDGIPKAARQLTFEDEGYRTKIQNIYNICVVNSSSHTTGTTTTADPTPRQLLAGPLEANVDPLKTATSLQLAAHPDTGKNKPESTSSMQSTVDNEGITAVIEPTKKPDEDKNATGNAADIAVATKDPTVIDLEGIDIGTGDADTTGKRKITTTTETLPLLRKPKKERYPD